MKKTLQKGFTLVELLVVMGILAILMAAVVVGIDPLDKLNAAADAKAQQDVATIAKAMEAYAAGHGGTYPCYAAGVLSTSDFTLSGELKAIPAAPSGRTYDYAAAGAQCNTNNGAISVVMKAKKFTSDTRSSFYTTGGAAVYWVWCATSAKAEQRNAATCP